MPPSQCIHNAEGILLVWWIVCVVLMTMPNGLAWMLLLHAMLLGDDGDDVDAMWRLLCAVICVDGHTHTAQELLIASERAISEPRIRRVLLIYMLSMQRFDMCKSWAVYDYGQCKNHPFSWYMISHRSVKISYTCHVMSCHAMIRDNWWHEIRVDSSTHDIGQLRWDM